jgi:hypothetical protein
MENKKVITKQDLLNEAAMKPSQINESDIEQLFTKYMGEYQPDEFSPSFDSKPKGKTKESDMGEGKLFTKLLTGK